MSSSPDASPISSARAPGWVKAMLGLHVKLYRLTGGLLGYWLGPGHNTLLLTTTGRKSGRKHSIPLTYFRDGSSLFVVASNGGSDHPPAWYLDLSANPNVEVEVKRNRFQATATTATPEEYSRLWQRLATQGPQYRRYQTRTSRAIPIVLLHPRRQAGEAR